MSEQDALKYWLGHERKPVRVSVSWLGHPDRETRTIGEARELVRREFCRRGRPPVFGEFAPLSEFREEYGEKLAFQRANWWREGESEARYEGAIIAIYKETP